MKEARWLPYLHDALPVEVPEIVAVGEPGHGYPEHWSVLRWIAGVQPSMGTSTQLTQEQLAHDLADVLRALRDLEVPPTGRDDAALHWYRAGPLTATDADIRDYAEQCRDMPGLDLDIDAVVRLWDEAMAVADGPSPGPHWLHGDLLADHRSAGAASYRQPPVTRNVKAERTRSLPLRHRRIGSCSVASRASIRAEIGPGFAPSSVHPDTRPPGCSCIGRDLPVSLLCFSARLVRRPALRFSTHSPAARTVHLGIRDVNQR